MKKNFEDVKIGDIGSDSSGYKGKVVLKSTLGVFMNIAPNRIVGKKLYTNRDAPAVLVDLDYDGKLYVYPYGRHEFLVDDIDNNDIKEIPQNKFKDKLKENIQSGDIFIVRGKNEDANYVKNFAVATQTPACMVDGKMAFKMTIEQIEELLEDCEPSNLDVWECLSDIHKEAFDSDTLTKIYDIESAVWDID